MTKSFYKLQPEINLQTLVAHFNSSSGDLTDWTVKQQAVQAMRDDIVQHLRQYLPVDKNQKFLEQIEALKVEDEKLRQQQGQESTSARMVWILSCKHIHRNLNVPCVFFKAGTDQTPPNMSCISIQLGHIPDLVRFLLDHSFFSVGVQVFQQTRGASMCSQ